MTRLQKLIVVGTLLLLAALLHTFFCDRDSGLTFTGNSDFRGSRTRTIIPLGSESAIVGRSQASLVTDMLGGIAVPIVLVGCALHLLVSPTRNNNFDS